MRYILLFSFLLSVLVVEGQVTGKGAYISTFGQVQTMPPGSVGQIYTQFGGGQVGWGNAPVTNDTVPQNSATVIVNRIGTTWTFTTSGSGSGDSGIAGGWGWKVTATKPRIGIVDTTRIANKLWVNNNFMLDHINYTTTALTTINLGSANFVGNAVIGATAINNLTINLPNPASTPTNICAIVQVINNPLVLINPHGTELINDKTATGGLYLGSPAYTLSPSISQSVFSYTIHIYTDNTNWVIF